MQKITSFFFDGESYVLFNAPTKVKITDKSDITTRAMFISRLVGMEARATSIVPPESSFQTSAKISYLSSLRGLCFSLQR